MANYSSNLDKYIENLITDVLPMSDLSLYNVNSSGLVPIDQDTAINMRVELPDSVKAGIYTHEKCSTTRYGVLTNRENSSLGRTFHSYYFRPFKGNVLSAFQKLIAQSVLELYPTPLQTYAVVTNPVVEPVLCGAVVDLNHLKTPGDKLNVEAIRFDILLNSLGLNKDINSFIELQAFMKDENVKKLLSERAIVQIGLCSYFIPNAIGEVDANSRNIILLKDPRTQKYEYVARIDAESNTYFNALNGERSGKKILPKGIYSANEYLNEEFLKTIKQKDASIDWQLFSEMMNITSIFTKRSRIDESIFNGYKRNYFRVPYDEKRPASAAANHFGLLSYGDFSNETILRAKRFTDNVMSALGGPLFSDNVPFEKMEVKKPERFEMKLFNAQGEEIEREM